MEFRVKSIICYLTPETKFCLIPEDSEWIIWYIILSYTTFMPQMKYIITFWRTYVVSPLENVKLVVLIINKNTNCVALWKVSNIFINSIQFYFLWNCKCILKQHWYLRNDFVNIYFKIRRIFERLLVRVVTKTIF